MPRNIIERAFEIAPECGTVEEVRHRLGREGFINVIEQSSADKYELTEKIPTSPGARTSLFSAELNRFFLGVPHEGQQKPEVRIYQPR